MTYVRFRCIFVLLGVNKLVLCVMPRSETFSEDDVSPSVEALKGQRPVSKVPKFRWPDGMEYVSEKSPPPKEVALVYELAGRIARNAVDAGRYNSVNKDVHDVNILQEKIKRSDSLVSDRPFTDRGNEATMEAFVRAAKREGFLPKVGILLKQLQLSADE
jgi:hypothetical protein